MGFLVFPSSTHTRFAHALGACHLGRLAATRVRVRDVGAGTAKPATLGEFLRANRWVNEFYLSLLLHDIGHFPFSHTVERTHLLERYLGSDYKHEEAASELIRGRGEFYEAFKRSLQRYGALRAETELSEVVRRSCRRKQDRSIEAICYLISEKGADLHDFEPEQVAQLELLHELVSGLLDLDRMDHYRRDLYFNGVRAGTVINFECLLSGITMTYNPTPAGTSEKPPRRERNAAVSLSGAAMGQVVSLLQIKSGLQADAFHNPKVLAYEAMIGEALRLHIEDPPKGGPSRARVFDLLVMTDDRLLEELVREGKLEVRNLVERIHFQSPYRLIFRLVQEHRPSDPQPDLQSIDDVVKEVCQPLGRVLVFGAGMPHKPSLPDGKRAATGRPDTPSKEWLSIKNLNREPDPEVVVGKKDPYAFDPSHFQGRFAYSVWVFTERNVQSEEAEPFSAEVVRRINERFDSSFSLALVPR